MKTKKLENILFIADTQIPFERKDYLPFLKAVSKKYKTTRNIHIGDAFDLMNWSRYPKDPNSESANEELAQIQLSLLDWESVFPEMEIVIGNHDRRASAKLREAGFTRDMIPFETLMRTVYGSPEGWTWHNDIKIETPMYGTVLCIHGDQQGASVRVGGAMAKTKISTILGHFHSVASIKYESTPNALLFEMRLGCGIDDNREAFNYNKGSIGRPIYSCGVLVDGMPHLIPMKLDENGDWCGTV